MKIRFLYVMIIAYFIVVCFSIHVLPVWAESVCGNEVTFESADGTTWLYRFDHDIDESILGSKYNIVVSNQFTDSTDDDEIVFIL